MKVLILDSAPTPTTHSGKTVRQVNLKKCLTLRAFEKCLTLFQACETLAVYAEAVAR